MKVIANHRIYNSDLNKFTSCKDDKETPIGMHTINSRGETIKLVKKKYRFGTVDVCNVITDYYINLYGNGILTSRGLNNLYPISDDMKFIKSERECFKREELKDIPDDLYYGLRIGETPREFMGSEEKTKESLMKFIDRTISTKNSMDKK